MKLTARGKEIKEIRRKGKKVELKYFTGYKITSGNGILAIITSKVLGNAVIRNRIRRRLKEAYRKIYGEYLGKSGKQLSFLAYAKKGVIEANNEELLLSIKNALGII